jgi:hypothetical protein
MESCRVPSLFTPHKKQLKHCILTHHIPSGSFYKLRVIPIVGDMTHLLPLEGLLDSWVLIRGGALRSWLPCTTPPSHHGIKFGISVTLLQTNPPRPPPSLSHPQLKQNDRPIDDGNEKQFINLYYIFSLKDSEWNKTNSFLSLTRSAPL